MNRLARYVSMALIGTLSAPASAQELGRLFFTPEQRQALDRRRQLNIQERQDVEDPTLTINGVVTRSSGKRTVWVNGVAQSEVPSGATVVTPDHRDPGQVLVQPADAPAVKARVGDTINRNSGEATELLGGGSIKPGRPLSASPK